MRIELLPVVLGLLAVGIGIVLVVDAAVPDGTFISVERRRGQRPPRNCLGEGLLGAAIILLGASLIGRDSWPYTTLSVLLAVALGAAGVAMNWHYLRDMAVAPVRRSGESSLPAEAQEAPPPTRDQLISDEQSPASLG
jgi:hypothetical protein